LSFQNNQPSSNPATTSGA